MLFCFINWKHFTEFVFELSIAPFELCLWCSWPALFVSGCSCLAAPENWDESCVWKVCESPWKRLAEREVRKAMGQGDVNQQWDRSQPQLILHRNRQPGAYSQLSSTVPLPSRKGDSRRAVPCSGGQFLVKGAGVGTVDISRSISCAEGTCTQLSLLLPFINGNECHLGWNTTSPKLYSPQHWREQGQQDRPFPSSSQTHPDLAWTQPLWTSSHLPACGHQDDTGAWGLMWTP